MWTHRRSGKINQRSDKDQRNPYERDRTRAIHSPAFRRLQSKTQILGTDEGDFHRTRLTHSLETASIGLSIARHLMITETQASGFLPNDDLITAICLLHDIGHPPFGHGGEAALNFMMRMHGGFEGNGQTLRLLTKLEKSYGNFGLDLTRRALLGLLKYPVPYTKVNAPEKTALSVSTHTVICINEWLPPKSYYDSEEDVITWLLQAFSEQDIFLFQSLKRNPAGLRHGQSAYYSFDCAIMNLADDIAYVVHDLEDAIHLHLIQQDQLNTSQWQYLLNATELNRKNKHFINSLFSSNIGNRKQAIGELVNYFITAIRISISHPDFTNPLLKHTVTLLPEAENLLHYLKQFVAEHVINSQEARILEFGGQTIVLKLFEAISANPHTLLDKENRILFEEADSAFSSYRVICDYIANMTDKYAYRLHERLFGFNTRTIFERI